MVTPASENRAAMIAKEADGFLYVVSGPDNRGSEVKKEFAAIVRVIKENTEVPCVIGADIAAPEQAMEMADLSDGIIVDAAIVKLLEQYGQDAPEHIGAYVKSMKEALI